MIIIFIGLHVKYQLFLSDSNKSWIFSTVFSKNTEIPNLIKTRPMGTELFYAGRRTDGRMDRHEVNSRFSQFCESA